MDKLFAPRANVRIISPKVGTVKLGFYYHGYNKLALYQTNNRFHLVLKGSNDYLELKILLCFKNRLFVAPHFVILVLSKFIHEVNCISKTAKKNGAFLFTKQKSCSWIFLHKILLDSIMSTIQRQDPTLYN